MKTSTDARFPAQPQRQQRDFMADISLKEYLEKVDSLLRTGKSDEVILHCRQILKHYPKNAAASRYLGQALLNTSAFKDAEALLQRVLAVYPNDAVTLAALGELNERLGKPDEAIWYLERALEQTPNDNAVVAKLRQLYQRHRNIDNPRFQLTTGAVARQYVRNGLFTQAIDTLKATLERSPRRVDLRLLLAETQWNAGLQVEAAETALDVLETLPHCLEANRLLTLLWLSEGRPSDAQQYLNQIQDVEPYLALELARSAPPDESAFMLPEIDYRRAAESQLATERPDWLQDIGNETELSDRPGEPASATASTGAAFDSDEDMFAGDVSPKTAGLPGGAHSGLTGLLSALGGQPDEEIEEPSLEAETELPDWLMNSAPLEMAETTLDADADALDWLQEDAADQALSEGEVPDFFADFEDTNFDLPAAGTFEPSALDWLESAGGELAEEQPPVGALIDEEDEMYFQDPESIDPLAWLEDAGIELAEEQPPASALIDEEDEMRFQDPESIDPLAWLGATNAELIETPFELETASSERITENTDADETEAAISAPLDIEADGLEWLSQDMLSAESGSGVVSALSELDDFPEPETEKNTEFDNFTFASIGESATDMLPGSQSQSDFAGREWQSEMSENKPIPPDSQDDSELDGFEWLEDASAADETDEAPSWLTPEPDEQSGTPASSETPAWLTAAGEDSLSGEFSWLTEVEDEAEDKISSPSDSSAEPDASAFDWAEDETPEPETAAVPDWLAAAAPAAQQADDDLEAEFEAADSAFDWAEDETPEPETPAVPDWLAAVAPAAQQADDDLEAEFEAADDSAFDWAEDETPEPETAAVPDWLAAAAPAAQQADDDLEAEFEAADSAFDWAEDETPEPETPAVPDWLAAAVPAAQQADDDLEAEFEAADDSAFDWAEDETPEPKTAAVPDWLAAVAPAAQQADDDLEAEFEAEEETLFETQEAAEALPELDEEKILAAAVVPPPADNAPDWLNAMVPGLDLNYEAVEDDRPIETEYVQSAPARRQRPGETTEGQTAAERDLDWLNAIVEQETGPMPSVAEAAAAEPIRQRGRFRFSRPPMWLRNLTAKQDEKAPQSAQKSDTPDINAKDDDFDLPEWLR
jgi:hypothetical protein